MSAAGVRTRLAALLVVAAVGLGAPFPAPAQVDLGGLFGGGDEAKIGEREHEQATEQFGGRYDDKELQAYITGIGERLKAVTPMAGEKFTFTLLNSDVINAFAMPGGYVYITRGLLALAQDEAQVAGVLGHEIGHIVAHHTSQRMQRSTLTQLGALAATVLGGYFGGQAGAQVGGQLAGGLGTFYVQSFSREQESEADQLGIRFLEAAGYDPRAMASFLEQLEANEQLEAKVSGREAGGNSWLSDHPRTADRVVAASAEAAAAKPTARERDPERFMSKVDGMLYGDDPAQGIVNGRTFEHPDLGFRFTAPEGFVLRNSPAAVTGQDRAGRIMQFTMKKGSSSDPADFLERDVGQRTKVSNVRSFTTAGGLPAASGLVQAKVQDQTIQALLVAIPGEGQGNFYNLLYADAQGLSRADLADFEASAKTFQRISKTDAAKIRPMRIVVHTVRSGETPESLSKQMVVDRLPLDTFRLINGLKPGDTIRPGDAVKLVTRG